MIECIDEVQTMLPRTRKKFKGLVGEPSKHWLKTSSKPALSAKVGLLNGTTKESVKSGMFSNVKEVRQHMKAGIIAVEKGEYELALTYLGRILQLQPDSYQAWNNIGVCYLRMGDYEAAQKCFDKSLEINPDYKLVLINKNLLRYKYLTENDSASEALVKLALF